MRYIILHKILLKCPIFIMTIIIWFQDSVINWREAHPLHSVSPGHKHRAPRTVPSFLPLSPGAVCSGLSVLSRAWSEPRICLRPLWSTVWETKLCQSHSSVDIRQFLPLISWEQCCCGRSLGRVLRAQVYNPLRGFPGGSAGKESACSMGDLGLIPGLGRSPGEGRGYPL